MKNIIIIAAVIAALAVAGNLIYDYLIGEPVTKTYLDKRINELRKEMRTEFSQVHREIRQVDRKLTEHDSLTRRDLDSLKDMTEEINERTKRIEEKTNNITLRLF